MYLPNTRLVVMVTRVSSMVVGQGVHTDILAQGIVLVIVVGSFITYRVVAMVVIIIDAHKTGRGLTLGLGAIILSPAQRTVLVSR